MSSFSLNPTNASKFQLPLTARLAITGGEAPVAVEFGGVGRASGECFSGDVTVISGSDRLCCAVATESMLIPVDSDAVVWPIGTRLAVVKPGSHHGHAGQTSPSVPVFESARVSSCFSHLGIGFLRILFSGLSGVELSETRPAKLVSGK
mgnify:FL=1